MRYIYDREFILEYLLKEKKKLAEDKDKFDAQEAKKERSSVTRYLHRRRSSKAHQLGFLLFLSPLSSIFVYATTTRERRALTPAAFLRELELNNAFKNSFFKCIFENVFKNVLHILRNVF